MEERRKREKEAAQAMRRQHGPPDFSALPVTVERQSWSKAQRTALIIGVIAIGVSALPYVGDIMEYFDVAVWSINVGVKMSIYFGMSVMFFVCSRGSCIPPKRPRNHHHRPKFRYR